MIEPWLADLITLVLIAGGLVCIALTAGRESHERYCPACKKQTPWHPKRGCTVCRTLDQCF